MRIRYESYLWSHSGKVSFSRRSKINIRFRVTFREVTRTAMSQSKRVPHLMILYCPNSSTVHGVARFRLAARSSFTSSAETAPAFSP